MPVVQESYAGPVEGTDVTLRCPNPDPHGPHEWYGQALRHDCPGAAPVRLALIGTLKASCPGERQRGAERFRQAIVRLRPAVVISGGADGYDSIAAAVAESMGFSEPAATLVVHRPTVRRFHGPGGYRERDARIAADCTHLLRLACVKSTTYGSGWTADEAERHGKTVVRDSRCRESGDME